MNKNLLYFAAKIFLLCILLMMGSIFNHSYAQTTLTTGDIAIIGFKTAGSGDDAIKLMTMVDLTCGTTFIITDNNWDNSPGSWACNNDEFGLEITVTSKICAGSVLYIDVDNSGATKSSSSGNFIKTSLGNPWGTNFGFNSGGDNAFVLTGTRAAPTFIFGLKHNGAFADNTCSNRDQTGKPTALTLGTTAIVMNSTEDEWHYNCSNLTSGTKANLLASIGNKAKWTTSGTWNSSTCVFTITDPCTAPTHKATSFAGSSISQTSTTISWSNCPAPGVDPGNTKVLVIARAGTPVATDPTSGTTYTANSAFGSASTAIGDGFVVYNGTGTTVNLTGLTAGTTYYFSIYEYSCAGNCYNTDDLPGVISTLASLPVDLLYFHAKKEANGLLDFDWVTTSEKNNERFEVESSSDGIHFISIGTVKGKGNSKEYQTYRFSWLSDETSSYFRLKQIDVDGKSQYSEIEKITTAETILYELFPVPASEELFVKTSSSSDVTVTLLDLFGKELSSTTFSGQELHVLDLKSLSTGTYMLIFTTDKQSSWKKFYKL